jgi:hypothetical protein
VFSSPKYKTTISRKIKISFAPATQLTRYCTKLWMSGYCFDSSQALKTPTPLASLDPGKKIERSYIDGFQDKKPDDNNCEHVHLIFP